MLKATLIGGIASLALAGAAFAQTTGSGTTSGTTGSGAMKMSSAECTAVWNKADAGKSGSVTESQAKNYVTNFKSADTNGDGKLSSTEFTSACDKGLVHDTASTGTGTGTTGTTKGAGSGMGSSGSGTMKK